MKEKEFDKLAKQETDRMLNVMCSKSADYADDKDKLFNFKQAGRMDNITPIEALRGMWLKHRASIQQGLDELLEGKSPRSRDWWIEKLTDDRNYNLLLLALLEEQYFISDGTSPGYEEKEEKTGTFTDFRMNVVPPKKRTPFEKMLELAMNYGIGVDTLKACFHIPAGTLMVYNELGDIVPFEDKQDEEYGEFTIRRSLIEGKGWYAILTKYMSKGVNYHVAKFLHKDCKLHSGYARAPGYFKSKAQAKLYINHHTMLGHCFGGDYVAG